MVSKIDVVTDNKFKFELVWSIWFKRETSTKRHFIRSGISLVVFVCWSWTARLQRACGNNSKENRYKNVYNGKSGKRHRFFSTKSKNLFGLQTFLFAVWFGVRSTTRTQTIALLAVRHANEQPVPIVSISSPSIAENDPFFFTQMVEKQSRSVFIILLDELNSCGVSQFLATIGWCNIFVFFQWANALLCGQWSGAGEAGIKDSTTYDGIETSW